MEPVLTEKRKLRRDILEARSKRSIDQIACCSAQLSRHLFSSSLWQNAEIVFAFVGSKGEPDTRGIFEECWLQGKQLYLPRVLGHDRLSFHRIERNQMLETGGFGIPEPPVQSPTWDDKGSTFETRQGIILVPGLGFDQGGHRIGYGKGYYDRFLLQFRDCGRLVGVCWKQMVYEGARVIPVEPHDISMNWLLSETGIRSVKVYR